jgi:hypothetical protein
MGNGLVVAKKLTTQSLSDLVAGRVEVIWHRSFFSADECERAMPRVVAACERSRYTLTTDLQSLGTSCGEAAESASNLDRYLATAAETTNLIRNEIFADRLSPLDKLRLLLDELWSAGATVGRCDGRMMLPGIVRRWPTGGHANPHIDQRHIDLLKGLALTRRIGTNVYLEVPPPGCGGELEFWHTFSANEDEYTKLKRLDYGLDRSILGAPLAMVAPAQGDLLMFDAARVHGVARVTGGSRATAAMFVGARGVSEPLALFA